MNFFLKLKAWQLFGLMYLPVVPYFFVTNEIPIALFQISVTIGTSFFNGWLYSIGIASNNRVPKVFKKNTIIFSIALLIPIIYFVLLAVSYTQDPNSDAMFEMMPLHLLSMAGMFYGLWFTTKQYSTFLKREELFIFDYGGNLFLFCFFPIGIWFIQPEINKTLGEEA